jgi:hypothetical protein
VLPVGPERARLRVSRRTAGRIVELALAELVDAGLVVVDDDEGTESDADGVVAAARRVGGEGKESNLPCPVRGDSRF